MQTKRTIVALIVTSLLSSTIFAHNKIYQFASDQEYLFAPLAGAIAGIFRCKDYNTAVKVSCATVGGILGAVDEIAIHTGFTDKHHLTWGALGIATGQIFTKSSGSLSTVSTRADFFPAVSDFVGVAVGMLLPTGILSDYKNMIAPAIAANAGGSILGIAGMIAGGAAGIFDEVLLDNDVIDKHYMTFGVAGMAATNLLEYFSVPLSNVIGVALGAIAANYEKEISSTLLAPINTAGDLYATYSKLIPKKQLDAHIDKQAIALVGGRFLTQFLSLKVLRSQQELQGTLPSLENANAAIMSDFKSKIMYYAVFLVPMTVGDISSRIIDNYFCKKLHYVLEDKIQSGLYGGNTLSRLAYDRNAAVLLDNYSDDIDALVYSGGSLITDAISTSINGVYGIGVIVISSPNILVYSSLYHQASAWVSEYLAKQQRFYEEKIATIKVERKVTINSDIENFETILENDELGIAKNRVQELSIRLAKYKDEQKFFGMTNDVYKVMFGQHINWLLNFFLVANEISAGKIKFKNGYAALDAIWKTSGLLSWSGFHAQDMERIGQSSDRVIVLEGKIHIPLNEE